MPTGSTAAGMTPSIGAEPTSSDPPTSAACSPPLPSFFPSAASHPLLYHPPLCFLLPPLFFSPYSRFCFLVFAKCVKTWRLIRKMHFFSFEARHYSKTIVFERTSQVLWCFAFITIRLAERNIQNTRLNVLHSIFFASVYFDYNTIKDVFKKKIIMHWARHLHFSSTYIQNIILTYEFVHI